MSETRNFAQEALDILAGKSSLLAQKEHLAALAQKAETALLDYERAKALLTAILLDADQPNAAIPTPMLRQQAVQGFTVKIERARRGEADYHIVTIERLAPLSSPKVTVQ